MPYYLRAEKQSKSWTGHIVRSLKAVRKRVAGWAACSCCSMCRTGGWYQLQHGSLSQIGSSSIRWNALVSQGFLWLSMRAERYVSKGELISTLLSPPVTGSSHSRHQAAASYGFVRGQILHVVSTHTLKNIHTPNINLYEADVDWLV